jgi:predicted secreted protein
MPGRILALLVGFALAATTAAAQTSAPAPNAPGDDGLVTLQLAESAQRQVIQDRLRAGLRIEVGGPDARTVQGQVNTKMAAALEKVKAVPSVRAETTGYYVYEDKAVRRGQRWWGNQAVTLVGTDTAALLTLVGQLQDDGLAILQLGYELAPETRKKVEAELIPEAVRRIREKAETTAQALGLTRIRVSKVKLGDLPNARPLPVGVARAMSADSSQPIAPPVAEPGETTVTVQIEAEVILRP